MKKAAIYFEHDPHLLDHIAPLCELLNMPLYISEEQDYVLAKQYYPQIQIIFKENKELNIEFLNQFDILFQCKFWEANYINAINELGSKKTSLVFCPHGNSDKGHIKNSLIKYFAMQDTVLCYGEHMVNLFKTHNILKHVKRKFITGNYRLNFYLKYKTFYDKLRNEIFNKLNPNNKTILYAPTWYDIEESTSFFDITTSLIDKLPPNFNLLIKPHPLLEIKKPGQFYQLYESNKENLLFVEDFLPIFPLLEKADAYLGDFSSIGYDFLFFQKPMFFVDVKNRDISHPSRFLHRCGISLDAKQDLFYQMNQYLNNWPEELKAKQKEIFEYAFDKKVNENEIRSAIESIRS
jgi:teichoic acid glycerol-phosphate primase